MWFRCIGMCRCPPRPLQPHTPVLPAAAGDRRPERTGAALGAGTYHAEGSLRVNKIRISKRHRPASWRLEPLPADPCDGDIVRAKQLADLPACPLPPLAPAAQSLTTAVRTRMIVMPSASSAARAGPLPCQRGHGELWFSELPAELEQARAHCQQCPLRTACLAGALELPSHAESGAARSSTREPSSRARGRAGDRPRPGPMPAQATPAAQRRREEIMHPFILQQLAAEHVRDQLAAADNTRRACPARRARRSRASRQQRGSACPARRQTRTALSNHRSRRRFGRRQHRPWGRTVQVEARVQTPGHMPAPTETARSSSPLKASPRSPYFLGPGRPFAGRRKPCPH
jgi:WhiB family transcriptional regulator, redox-sensing transcriptional regulator